MEIEVVIFIIMVVFAFIYSSLTKSKKNVSNTENTNDEIKKPTKSWVEYDRRKIQSLSKNLLIQHISKSKTKVQAENYHFLVDEIINICESEKIPYTIESVNELFDDVVKSQSILELINNKLIEIEEEIKKQKRQEEAAKWLQELQERNKRELHLFELCKKEIYSRVERIAYRDKYSDTKKKFEDIVFEMINFAIKYYELPNNYKSRCEEFTRKTLSDELQKKKSFLMKNSPLYNYFEAVDGGETTLYYLKLNNKFGETRYKIGVTLQDVKTRYKGINHPFIILYEKKLTHANAIEKKVLQEFSHLITDESLLGTTGSEILKEDVLSLDK